MYQVLGTWINWPTCSRTAVDDPRRAMAQQVAAPPRKEVEIAMPSASQIHDPSPLHQTDRDTGGSWESRTARTGRSSPENSGGQVA